MGDMAVAFAVDETLNIRQEGDEFLVVPFLEIQLSRMKPVFQPAPWIAFAALRQQFPVMLSLPPSTSGISCTGQKSTSRKWRTI